MIPPPLDITQDISVLLSSIWPTLVLILFLTVSMLYLTAYAWRYFEYLKAQESKYLDRHTLDFIKKVLASIWIGLALIAALFAVQFNLPEISYTVRVLGLHLPSILIVVMTLFAAVVLARGVRRFASYMRGHLEIKPKRVAPPGALSFAEVFLKYFIYGIGVAIAFYGGLALLPGEDTTMRDWMAKNIFEPTTAVFNARTLGLTLVTIVFTYAARKLLDSVLDDIKRRTKRFSPKVLDVLRSVGRYIIWGVTSFAILFIFLSVVLSAEQLVLVLLAVVILVLILVIVMLDPLRDSLAGISLMNSDPFSAGETIKVGNDLVCDVLQVGLTFTQLRTLKGEIVNMSNRELLARTIANYSRSESYPMTIGLGVSFDVPHWRVERLLLDATKGTEGILNEPSPHAFAKGLQGNNISYELCAHTARPREIERIKSDLIARIQELFHKEGLKVLLSQAEQPII